MSKLGNRMAAFEKNIAGNQQANGTSSTTTTRNWKTSSSSSNTTPAKKWEANRTASKSPPKFGQGSLKRTATTTNTPSSPKNSANNLRRIKSSDDGPVSSTNSAPSYNWKTKINNSSQTKSEEPNTIANSDKPLQQPSEPSTCGGGGDDWWGGSADAATAQMDDLLSKEDDTATATTADLTTEEKLEASDKDLSTTPQDDASTATDKKEKDKKSKDKSSKDKDKKSSKKSSKKKPEGSIFALEEGEYLIDKPPELRTQGTFDWSGVDSVIQSMILDDKKTQKKKEKLQQKLDNINKTKEDALKMMSDHVKEQKQKMDDKRDELRKKIKEQMNGMTYDEMVEKVKEQHDIVASLKKSNNKLRNDNDKMRKQIHTYRVNNMKLEAANEQSEAVLEQLKERKKSVDARYEHLTKVIIPPYQERIKEMEDVVEERKLYGNNEHRTRVRYGNYIMRFLDKIDNSDESKKLKEDLWEMGAHVEGGELPELSDDENDDDDDKSEDSISNLPAVGNASTSSLGASLKLASISDLKVDGSGSDKDDSNSNNNSSTNNNKANNKSKSTEAEKSLWDRYGAGGDSSSKVGGNASGSNLGKHADLLSKANRAKAANFNGAVILSDSDSDSDSDDDDSSSAVSSSSDDS